MSLIFGRVILLGFIKFSKNLNLTLQAILFIILRRLDYRSRSINRAILFFSLDRLTYWLILIVLVSIILGLLATEAWAPQLKIIKVIPLISLIRSLRCLIFLSTNLLIIYVIFEISVVPIFLIILGWGYQPERIAARTAIFFYTAACSVPLLVMLLTLKKFYGSINWNYFFSSLFNGQEIDFILITVILFLAFLVKLPIFSLHIWLPKAHVEAPVYGSIILAAVMLKLGGLGLTRVLPLALSLRATVPRAVRAFGLVTIRLLCVFLFDLKMIVAYSSVAHMALVVLRVFTRLKFGLIVGLLIMIRHAFTSSMLFFGVTKIYAQTNRRSILLNSGNLIRNFKFSLLWILTLIASIATPPLINFFREVISFIVVGRVYPLIWPLVILTVFFGGVYSLLIFTSTQHGKLNFKYSKIIIFRKIDFLNRAAHGFLYLPSIFMLIIFF